MSCARGWGLVLMIGLAAGCGGRRVQATPPATAAWGVVFERELGIHADGLAIARRGDVITAGGFRFDAAGRFMSPVSIQVPGGEALTRVRALLADGRALVTADAEPYELLVGRLDQAPADVTVRVATGQVFGLALSADGARVATLEGKAVVVRRLPDLGEEWRAEAGEEWDWEQPAVGFLADGRVVALTEGGAVEIFGSDGSRVTLAAAAEKVGAAAFARAGDAAVVSFEDGRVRVLALPGGEPIGTLPRPADANTWITLAISDGAETVAIDDCEQLRVFGRPGRGARYQQLFAGRNPDRHHGGGCELTPELLFATDGRSLLVEKDQLTVLAAVAPGGARPAPPPEYAATVPADFTPEMTFDWRGGTIGTGWGRTPRRTHGWFHDVEHEYAGLTVELRDAAELAGRDLDAWGEAFLTRYDGLDPDDRYMIAYQRVWRDAHDRRTLEYAVFMDQGCELENRYVRVVEDGPYLIQVTLTTPPGVSPALVRAWLAAFADAPLGAPPTRLGERRIAPITRHTGC